MANGERGMLIQQIHELNLHTVISIGLSPKTICAPTSSDNLRAARNCIIDKKRGFDKGINGE